MNTCTEQFGHSITARYLKNTISTISTVINQTTALPIWNVYQPLTTPSIMQRATSGSEAKGIKNNSKKCRNWRKNGINQKKESTGTRNTLKTLVLESLRKLRKRASGAVKNTLHQDRGSQNSAIRTAKRLIYVSDGSKQKVYDLTIDHHHAYIANGVLVSNSDAWRYLAITWKESRKTQKVVSDHQKLINGNIVGLSFGEMTKQHFKNKRKQRNNLWS